MNYREYPIDVRWGDMDLLGHVNNVTYLSYFETARVDLILAMGTGLRKEGVACVVVQANISYKASVEYPAALKVVTSIGRIGNTSMVFRQCLRERDGERVFCEADITVVWMNMRDNKPVAVPAVVREWAQLDAG